MASGDRLQERILGKVFPLLAEGLIVHLRKVDQINGEIPQERLNETFQATLNLLYQVLVLLYAEARGLPSLRTVHGGSPKSLFQLTREVAEIAGDCEDRAVERLGRAYSADPADTTLYERLLVLISRVDETRIAASVPGYDAERLPSGTLEMTTPFKTEVDHFLLRYRVPDHYFAQALDLLAREVDETRGRLVPIVYRSMGVRQLGSIYQGLLDLRLRTAPGEMAPVEGKKGGGRVLAKGTVYLENDRRGRKSIGAYYTPDHIVEDIVEQTVGRALAKHLESMMPRLREAERALLDAKACRDPAEAAAKRNDSTGVHDEEGPQRLVNDLLSFRVLDPAMGSGNFLVEALNLVTRRMINFLSRFSQEPVEVWLRKSRETLRDEIARPAVAAHVGELTATMLLKRLVLERCIYGVDLDPMAVKLAKAALWLECFSPDVPPPVLDSHLKCGNFLIDAPMHGIQFDVVVGNPPWVSHSGRHAVALAMGEAALYSARFDSAKGWRATQSMFTEAAATVLSIGGRLGLLLPAQVSDLRGFLPMRARLAAMGRIEEPCPYYGEDAFKGVTEPAISVVFVRGEPCLEQRARWRIADEGAGSVRLSSAETDEGILKRVRQRLSELDAFGKGSFGDPGVHSGNASKDLIAAEGGPGRAPIREGKDVLPFVARHPRVFLRLDLAKTKKRYFRIGPLSRYLVCPIVVRQTASRPIAALHTEPTYFRNSVLACYGLPGIPHSATVGLLNSELFAWLHRDYRDARQVAFPQVKVSHLVELPRPGALPDQRSARAEVWIEKLRVFLPMAGESMPKEFLEQLGSMSLEDRAAACLGGIERCSQHLQGLSAKIVDPAERSILGGGSPRRDGEEEIRRLIEERSQVYDLCNELVFRLYGVSAEEASAIRRHAWRSTALR